MLLRRTALHRLSRSSRVFSAAAPPMKHYLTEYRKSIDDPEAFWDEAAKDIHWFKPYTKVLDKTNAPFYKWFPDGEMNTCYNALDVHVANGKGDAPAIFYESPMTGTKRTITYAELLEHVEVLAGALARQGVTKGDRVVIYMPMIPETAMAMLACARLGAIHSVVFGGFSAKELAVRLEDAKPKVVLSASCGLEPKGIIEYEPMLKGAIELSAHKPELCVVYQRQKRHYNLGEKDMSWADFIDGATPHACVPVKSTDPLYILYTSGTTGKPKGVVRDHGGHNVALKWAMQNIMGMNPGETYWAASDFGWVVGHSFIVYAPLFHGCATVIYEGKPVGTPDAGAFWRVISSYNVKALFTAPTALRAIRKEDPDATFLHQYKKHMSHLKTLFVAGERGDPATIQFFTDQLQLPIVDNWWQTEIGWPVCSQMMGMDQRDANGSEHPGIKYGSASRPVPGFDVVLQDKFYATEDKTHEHDPNDVAEGSILLRLPLPPGTFTTLYNNDVEYVSKYMDEHPGYYTTGDAGHIDDDNYVYIMSRTDDIINVAGHRLCTGAIEEVIQTDDNIAECAVVGVADALKGHIPVAFAVLKSNTTASKDEVASAIVARVRSQIGSFVCLKDVLIVDQLPKTRSGKIVRRTIQAIADSRPYTVPATIENESVLVDIAKSLQTIGYAK
ncbi:propionyl-CoA synthetase [Saprolegnia diclina VS20]|uniref:Propionyl-CoA synthetase n=1 Tax=Saprolegnia diclina (strain VS20) TaxID=1156394 RepID=T0Q5M1_SAPDV|nr:propionyl-CoA synthetase [Saprolegnia diclina VS20]EQC28735.1 propionyl-CoA synthetase [Saprolegnia diclina VS20]|eukprot:XP_008617927.1 propionyl-CoA synthetase [Saprolegnia diclina VS20]